MSCWCSHHWSILCRLDCYMMQSDQGIHLWGPPHSERLVRLSLQTLHITNSHHRYSFFLFFSSCCECNFCFEKATQVIGSKPSWKKLDNYCVRMTFFDFNWNGAERLGPLHEGSAVKMSRKLKLSRQRCHQYSNFIMVFSAWQVGPLLYTVKNQVVAHYQDFSKELASLSVARGLRRRNCIFIVL